MLTNSRKQAVIKKAKKQTKTFLRTQTAASNLFISY